MYEFGAISFFKMTFYTTDSSMLTDKIFHKSNPDVIQLWQHQHWKQTIKYSKSIQKKILWVS